MDLMKLKGHVMIFFTKEGNNQSMSRKQMSAMHEDVPSSYLTIKS